MTGTGARRPTFAYCSPTLPLGPNPRPMSALLSLRRRRNLDRLPLSLPGRLSLENPASAVDSLPFSLLRRAALRDRLPRSLPGRSSDNSAQKHVHRQASTQTALRVTGTQARRPTFAYCSPTLPQGPHPRPMSALLLLRRERKLDRLPRSLPGRLSGENRASAVDSLPFSVLRRAAWRDRLPRSLPGSSSANSAQKDVHRQASTPGHWE